MRVNLGLRPPNGPHYPVAPGVTLEAHTFDLLYPMITEYRMRHGIAPGDPVKDVDAYVCAKWPHACQQEPGDGPSNEDRKRGMAQRVATWAALMTRQMPQGGYQLVDDGAAKARAKACPLCPYNRNWRLGCAPCNRTSDALLGVLRKLRSVNVDSSLLGCEVCGHDNATAVFMPDSSMKPDEATKAKLPPGCWMKNL